MKFGNDLLIFLQMNKYFGQSHSNNIVNGNIISNANWRIANKTVLKIPANE